MLVVLAIIATLLAFAYPEVTSSIVADLRADVVRGSSPVVTIPLKVTKRMGEGFNYRIKPFFENTADGVANRFLSEKKPSKRPDPVAFTAGDCIECHSKLFEERTVSYINIDHRLHDALQIKCNECHADTEHPRPKAVAQKTCLDCHGSRVSGECGVCHAPGSILDSIAAEKTSEFLAGRTSDDRPLYRVGFSVPNRAWLRETSHGGDEGPCANCHEIPTFCNTCHLVFHDKVPSWRNRHGAKLLRLEYIQNSCWSCHDSNWCADTCHASPGLSRRRGWLPPPVLPVKKY